MADRRVSERARLRASQAAWAKKQKKAMAGEAAAASDVAAGEAVMATDEIKAVVCMTGVEARDDVEEGDVVAALSTDNGLNMADYVVAVARAEEAALAALTRINTEANASPRDAVYFLSMVRAGQGQLLARQHACNSDEWDFIEGLQRAQRDGATRKRSAVVFNPVVGARVEQARRERQSASEASYEVSLVSCLLTIIGPGGVDVEDAWEAARGGPGARWCGAVAASGKRQCVQTVGVQQQWPVTVTFNDGAGSSAGGSRRAHAKKERRALKRGTGRGQ